MKEKSNKDKYKILQKCSVRRASKTLPILLHTMYVVKMGPLNLGEASTVHDMLKGMREREKGERKKERKKKEERRKKKEERRKKKRAERE